MHCFLGKKGEASDVMVPPLEPPRPAVPPQLSRALLAPGVQSACWGAPNCLSRRPMRAVRHGGRMRHKPACNIRTAGMAPCPHIEDHVGAAVHSNGSRCPAIQCHQMLVAVDARSRSRAPALWGAHEALPRALQAPGVHSACWAAPKCLGRRPTGAVSRGGRMRHKPACNSRTTGVAPCPPH